MENADIVIIGAGVVGCAAAAELSRKSRAVFLLEKESRITDGVTARNSGVIHSGLYYPPNSLKAGSCIEGNRALYAWCTKYHVEHRKTGKLILAKKESEQEALESVYENARICGSPGVSRLTQRQLKKKEPALRAVAALFCSETGIVDPVQLAHSLLIEAENRNAICALKAEVTAIGRNGKRWILQTTRGPITASYIVNSSGLHADHVARMVGVNQYKIYPVRGDYFHLQTKAVYRHLIYPVQRKEEKGLGIHLTLDLAGQYRLGPDSQYVSSRTDFSPAEHKKTKFIAAAQALLGCVEPREISYDTCGIRPKLRSPTDPDEKDFVLREDAPGFVNLVGIDSPGLTASLDLARRVCELL